MALARLVAGFGVAAAALEDALVGLLAAVPTAWGVGGSTVRAAAAVALGRAVAVAARVLVLAGAAVLVAAAATGALRFDAGGAGTAHAVVIVNRIRGATWRNAANRAKLARFIVIF
jgi:hypothetical protein